MTDEEFNQEKQKLQKRKRKLINQKANIQWKELIKVIAHCKKLVKLIKPVQG